jgi:hypothetical protein
MRLAFQMLCSARPQAEGADGNADGQPERCFGMAELKQVLLTCALSRRGSGWAGSSSNRR